MDTKFLSEVSKSEMCFVWVSGASLEFKISVTPYRQHSDPRVSQLPTIHFCLGSKQTLGREGEAAVEVGMASQW